MLPVVLAVALISLVVEAQEPSAPERMPDDVLSGECLHKVHFGLNSSHGNVEALSLATGIDLCHDNGKRRWQLLTDVNLIRQLESGSTSLVERFETDGGFRSRIGEHWHWAVIFTGQVDNRNGIDARVYGGPGVGLERTPKWGRATLESGLVQTWEDAEGRGSSSFTEIWVRSTLAWRITKEIALMEKLDIFGRVDELSDYRVDSETGLAFRVSDRLAVRFMAELKWDYIPPPSNDKFDASIQTLLAYTWGKAASGN